MNSIWKFELQIEHAEAIDMPQGARPLTAQIQGSNLCLWAIVNTKAPLVKHLFYVGGTGHPLPEGSWLASVQDGPYVWHIFDGGEV